jgi:AcrR family transcriptional regulator
MAQRISDHTILDAVVETVVARGYGGASTREIAAAAGVNEVTLFRRFGNKRSLVLAAVQRDLREITSPALEVTGNLEADLLRVLEYYVRVYREHARLPLVLIFEATRNRDLQVLLREPLALQTRLREMISSYQQAGELVVEPPAQSVNALIGPLLAYGVDAQLGTSATSTPPEAQQLLERFLRGHRPA